MGIRLSDMHLVYSLGIVFEMVSPHAFNVSMFFNMVVASHDVISGTSFGSVWIMVFCSLSCSLVWNSYLRSMILC